MRDQGRIGAPVPDRTQRYDDLGTHVGVVGCLQKLGQRRACLGRARPAQGGDKLHPFALAARLREGRQQNRGGVLALGTPKGSDRALPQAAVRRYPASDRNHRLARPRLRVPKQHHCPTRLGR